MPTLLRRRPARLALTVLGIAAGALIGQFAVLSVPRSRAAAPVVAVFPIPGAGFASPRTQITFRGLAAGSLGPITVRGSRSGVHPGRIEGDSDGQGGSFLPTRSFTPGERVTVSTSLNVARGRRGSFSFTVATPARGVPGSAPHPAPRTAHDVYRFASRRDLTPAAVTVTHQPSQASPGALFVAPQKGPLQQGPMILGPYGGLVWFQPLPRGQSATDFRVQSYHGKPALTWWQGVVSHVGTGVGEGEIYDSSYRPVATVRAANGLSADLHEFELVGRNAALMTAYYLVDIDTPSGKRTVKRRVLDSVVQEIDIPTGLVLYQWDSLDHVPVSASYPPVPKNPLHPWDYFHVNSVQAQSDGSFVLSSRDTWAAYKVSGQTGAVIWTLGGKHSSFKLGPGASFAFQHDVRLRPGNLATLFDDGAGPPAVHPQSRALTLKLDYRHHTANLAAQAEHRPGLLAFFEGNVQAEPGGNELVGWGQQPYLTEFDAHGRTVFDARFVDANSSYRAYRFPWKGTPAAAPALAARRAGGRTTVWASWNGSTDVARWRVLGGASAAHLTALTTVAKSRFETAIPLSGGESYVAVVALDSRGRTLASSKTIRG